MPKVGMPEIRRPQLIQATIKVLDQVGMSKASVSLIGETAGVSPSIINHYFGGKSGLLEATMRYIIKKLATQIRKNKSQISADDPMGRIMAIVKANFDGVQHTSSWLAFWSRAMHDPMLYRLQQVNEKRLLSFLRFELKFMLPNTEARFVAIGAGALIDGLWLRGSLTPGGLDPKLAEKVISDYVSSKVPERFISICNNSTNS